MHSRLANHSINVVWIMRIGLFFQCLGVVWYILQNGSSINTQLYIYWDYPEDVAVMVDQVSGWLLLVMAICILVYPMSWCLIPIAFWFLLDSLASWSTESHMYPWLVPIAWSIRYMVPIALIMLIKAPVRWMEPALWMMRISIGATFTAHGLEALWHYPVFTDYIINAGNQLLTWRVSESQANVALTAIGVIDLVLAALIVSLRWRWVAFYMASWGLITAFSRMVHFGSGAWFEVFVRMSHFTIPLALMYYWHIKIKDRAVHSLTNG